METTTPTGMSETHAAGAPSGAPARGYYWGTGRRKTSVARVRIKHRLQRRSPRAKILRRRVRRKALKHHKCLIAKHA